MESKRSRLIRLLFCLAVIHIKKHEKELLQRQLDNEKQVLKDLEKQYKVVSCNDLDSVNSILNRKCEQIILTIFEADSEQDEIYNIFKCYQHH